MTLGQHGAGSGSGNGTHCELRAEKIPAATLARWVQPTVGLGACSSVLPPLQLCGERDEGAREQREGEILGVKAEESNAEK